MYEHKEIAEFCKTHTCPEAVAKFRCCDSTVKTACTKYGVKLVGKVEAKRKKIADWVKENNATVAEAARHFRVSRMKVSNAINAFGIPSLMPAVSNNNPNRSFEILKSLLLGRSNAEMVERHKVTRQRIHQVYQAAKESKLIGDDAIVSVNHEG